MRHAVILFSLFFILALSGCAATNPQYRDSSGATGDRIRIIDIAREYLGVPYRYGGTTPSGFDCSGYVTYVYKKAGHSLPREVGAMYQSLRHVDQPQPGDLVFYRIDGDISHVGIYAGHGRFIHSPKTGGVVEYANMNENYWRKRYVGAAAVL